MTVCGAARVPGFWIPAYAGMTVCGGGNDAGVLDSGLRRNDGGGRE